MSPKALRATGARLISSTCSFAILTTLIGTPWVQTVSRQGWDVAGTTVDIELGDTVVWLWDQDGYHNIQGKYPGQDLDVDDRHWGIEREIKTGNFSKTFTELGAYDYWCSPHSYLVFGTITVYPVGALPENDSKAHQDEVGSSATTVNSTVRRFYIQAEEIEWDYAPMGINNCKNRSFSHAEATWASKFGPTMTGGFIGTRYTKAVFRGYTDGSFSTRSRANDWDHLGLVGPVLHASVGDTVVVELRNTLSFGISFQIMAGVALDVGVENPADQVAPGSTTSYGWLLTSESGPGPADGSSLLHLYRSSADLVGHNAAGLMGPLVVTRAGEATSTGAPIDVDREMINLYWVLDENQSPFLRKNYEQHTDGLLGAQPPRTDLNFVESNLMYTINGYVYCNQPEQVVVAGQKVRWYVGAVGVGGSEQGAHTPHFHGNTWVNQNTGARQDGLEVIPGVIQTLDMVPDAEGVWMAHCHVNHHIHAGMITTYTVAPSKQASPFAGGGIERTYYVAADVVEWDYAPSEKCRCGDVDKDFTLEEQAYLVHSLGNPDGMLEGGMAGMGMDMAGEDMAGTDMAKMDADEANMVEMVAAGMSSTDRMGSMGTERKRRHGPGGLADGHGAGDPIASAALNSTIGRIGRKYLKVAAI